jgi:hypothetical protein
MLTSTQVEGIITRLTPPMVAAIRESVNQYNSERIGRYLAATVHPGTLLSLRRRGLTNSSDHLTADGVAVRAYLRRATTGHEAGDAAPSLDELITRMERRIRYEVIQDLITLPLGYRPQDVAQALTEKYGLPLPPSS